MEGLGLRVEGHLYRFLSRFIMVQVVQKSPSASPVSMK
jgi:hypothetical protein